MVAQISEILMLLIYKVLGKKEIINKQPNRESQSLLTFTCFQLKRYYYGNLLV